MLERPAEQAGEPGREALKKGKLEQAANDAKQLAEPGSAYQISTGMLEQMMLHDGKIGRKLHLNQLN